MLTPQFGEEFNQFGAHWFKLWEIFDTACEQVRAFDEDELDLSLAPDLLRHYAQKGFQRNGVSFAGIHRESLARNGICFRFRGRRIRVWKEPWRGRMFPITSHARKAFLGQVLLPTPMFSGDEPIDFNLVLLVRVDAAYRFRGFMLGLPQTVTRDGMPQYYWLEPVTLEMASQFVVGGTGTGTGPQTDEVVEDLPFEELIQIEEEIEEALGSDEAEEESDAE
jgi:hypothetical protein